MNINYMAIPGTVVTTELILQVVCDYYGVHIEDITGKRLVNQYNHRVRQVAHYLCVMNDTDSRIEIARKVGGVTHMAVDNSLRRIHQEEDYSYKLQRELQEINKIIKG